MDGRNIHADNKETDIVVFHSNANSNFRTFFVNGTQPKCDEKFVLANHEGKYAWKKVRKAKRIFFTV